MWHDVPFGEIDLRRLAELRGPERAFLSLYLSGPEALGALDHRVRRVRALLHDDPVELEYFEENLKLLREFLDENPPGEGACCLFACWALGGLDAFRLDRPVPDLLWVDAAPYIRPLAELQDEYENFVVVAVDNTKARVHLVTSARREDEARVRGDVKQNVKVGGWSQKRYERRRDKALHNYAKEIADVLAELDREAEFDRIVLLGTEETIVELREVLPEPLAEKVAGTGAADLQQDDEVWDRAFALFEDEERAAEASLWETVKGEYLRGGRAVAGAASVLEAAAVGRVEAMIVTRDVRLAGTRCRSCENLSAGEAEACPVCGEADVFTVDLVNELVDLLERSDARTEFADPIPALTEAGDVAALLRY